MQIKFVRHFESIMRNTWCKPKLLDIFCGVTAGFAYRRTSDFAFKNARRENDVVIDLDSFFAIKLLPERLKCDFDDSEIIFFSLVKKVLGFSFQHVVSLNSIVRAPQT